MATRREFARIATAAAAAFAGPAAGCGGEETSGEAPSDASTLPTLGGAPDTDQGRTIAAFVDTIVPGRHRDPDGAPGGIDVGAPAAFFDPELPAAQFVGILALVLDSLSKSAYGGRAFAALVPEERDAVVETALTDPTSPITFAIQLAKLAFFSTTAAGAYLGYPGANPGYYDDPELSFGAPMCAEITSDGNFP